MSRRARDAQLVARFVAERAGVDAVGPRYAELVAQVAHTMTRVGPAGAEEFRRSLEHDEELFDQLVNALTVEESYFFREAAQMELLRRRALPERAEARDRDGTLQLWSAGCAAGQEAYTLAILLREQGLASRSRVLATDLSRQALERARRGVYSKWSLRVLDARRRQTYFREVPGGFAVDPGLARFVTFRQHNLVGASPGRPVRDMDVVLCRNVLVYLTPAAIKSAGRMLVEALAPGGWLLTASTDPRLEGVEGLHAVVSPEGMAYRRLAGAPAGGARRRRTAPPPPRQAPPRRSAVSAQRPLVSASAAPGLPAGTPPASSSSVGPGDGRLAFARSALAQGDYEGAATAAAELIAGGGGTEADVILVRALGSAGRLGVAADAAAAAIARFPVHVELRLLQAIVLLESANALQAAAAARAAVYFDPELAMAHLTLARAEEALGDTAAARRSYRNALAVLEAMPAEHPVPLADGETARRLAGLARAGASGPRPATSRNGA